MFNELAPDIRSSMINGELDRLGQTGGGKATSQFRVSDLEFPGDEQIVEMIPAERLNKMAGFPDEWKRFVDKMKADTPPVEVREAEKAREVYDSWMAAISKAKSERQASAADATGKISLPGRREEIAESVVEAPPAPPEVPAWQPSQSLAGEYDSALGAYQSAKNKPIVDAGITASRRLRDIATGREFLDKAAPLTGWTSLIGSRVADTVGEFGQYFEKAGENMLRERTLKAFSDPTMMQSQLAKLAQGSGKLAGSAKWALEGLREAGQDGLKSRAFVLALQPEFRSLLGQEEPQ
jgi:hypothetical protein